MRRTALLTASTPIVAAFIRDHTGGNSKTATSTLTTSLSANVEATRTLVMMVSHDNSTATTPVVSSITVPGGESASWAQLGEFNSPTATGAGGVRGSLWVVRTTQQWLSSFQPVVTLSIARTAKGAVIREYSGVTATQRGSVAVGNSTTGVPTATNTAPLAGDLVIGGSGWEDDNVININADADSTNGSWSSATQNGSSGGLGGSNATAALQHKIVTATGSQTYNPTCVTSTDSGVVVACLIPG